jgi:signal transduction histidine kinase
MEKAQKCFTEEYVAQVVHDLKTPVVSIGGYAKRLREEKLGPLNQDQKEGLDVIIQTVERLEHDLGWIVEHAMAGEAVWEQVSPERFDLKEHVAQVVQSAKALAERNGQELRWDLPDQPVEIKGDSRMIDRAVSELIHNALKNSFSGGLVEVSLRRSADGATISITDYGKGFDPEKLDLLFQPWEKVVRMEDRNIRGVGLGLANVKRYAEVHGGRISAETSPGKGSTFRLELPPEPPEPPEIST